MKHFRLLLFSLLSLAASLSAQISQEFQFGSQHWDYPYKVMMRPDGSVSVVSGYSDTIPNSLGHVLLYHLSPTGAVLSQIEIARIATSLFIEAEADGSFWLGRLDSIGYGLSHHSPDGTVLSKFSYAHPNLWDDYFFAVRRIPGIGFALAFANADIPQPGVRVVSLSETGTVLWSKFISSQFPDFYDNALAVLPNGCIVVAVVDFSQGYQVNCYTPNGGIKWIKGMPQVPAFGEDFGLIPVGNDRVVLYGNGGQSTYNGFAGCYDANGNFAWNLTFETEAKNLYFNKGFADGDYTVLAGEYFNTTEFGLAVLKLDAQGNIVFKNLYPDLSGQKDNMIGARISNGDYIFSGYQWEMMPIGSVEDQGFALSMDAQGATNWLLFSQAKVHLMRSLTKDDMGNIWLYGQDRTAPFPDVNLNNFVWKIGGGVPQVNPFTAAAPLHLFPNPATKRVYVECPEMSGTMLTLEVRSATGSLTQQLALDDKKGQVFFDVSGWPVGLYMVTLRDERGAVLYQGKTVVQR
ncbi:MAG: hypothetical protein H7246_16950 [Phycisphaerae bacterium]|nr:hypothetical protein [Saprospiraceae bacterium]